LFSADWLRHRIIQQRWLESANNCMMAVLRRCVCKIFRYTFVRRPTWPAATDRRMSVYLGAAHPACMLLIIVSTALTTRQTQQLSITELIVSSCSQPAIVSARPATVSMRYDVPSLRNSSTPIIHRVSKKLCQLIFCSLSVKYEPI